MKIPRFVKEFASYTLRDIEEYSVNEEQREAAKRRVTEVVKACERGFITVYEAMHLIGHPFGE